LSFPPKASRRCSPSAPAATTFASLGAVTAGAPDGLLDSYEEERRRIAASMLGLTAKLLNAAKRGEMRRGREVQQLDVGYVESSLARKTRTPRWTARGRPCTRCANPRCCWTGDASVPVVQGARWTLLGYDVDTVRCCCDPSRETAQLRRLTPWSSQSAPAMMSGNAKSHLTSSRRGWR
jgi:hypothetical protein